MDKDRIEQLIGNIVTTLLIVFAVCCISLPILSLFNIDIIESLFTEGRYVDIDIRAFFNSKPKMETSREIFHSNSGQNHDTLKYDSGVIPESQNKPQNTETIIDSLNRILGQIKLTYQDSKNKLKAKLQQSEFSFKKSRSRINKNWQYIDSLKLAPQPLMIQKISQIENFGNSIFSKWKKDSMLVDSFKIELDTLKRHKKAIERIDELLAELLKSTNTDTIIENSTASNR